MSTVSFVFPVSGASVGPLPFNDPKGQTRNSNDPERSYTRFIVQTTAGVATDEVTLTFKHKEPGSAIPAFTKSTTDGSLKRVGAEGNGFKYRTFFQFITKAAGKWEITATVRRNGAAVATSQITVKALTTTWPFIKIVGGVEEDVHNNHGATAHGHSWFRPMNNPIVNNHNIPLPDRNTSATNFADRHDAIDFNVKLTQQGRAPFNGKVVHKHLISNSPSLGHYIHLNGKIVTTTGSIVRYRACIAHFTVVAEVGDQLIIGQSIGKQATQNFLHFALINLDDATGPQPLGCVTGKPNLMPPAGHGDRPDFLALSAAARNHVNNWQSATNYYASMRDNIRAAMLQKKFGH